MASFVLGPALACAGGLTFEVATVRPSPNGGNGYSGGCRGIDSTYSAGREASAPPLGRCVIRDARLSHMIAMAWGLAEMSQLKSGSDWVAIGGERFNVEAKAENPKATEAQLMEMLQNLLIERFQMKYHREEKEVQGFALVVAKNGPKFKEADPADTTERRFSGELKRDPAIIDGHKVGIDDLVDLLQNATQGPVVDRTGLKGVYNFRFTYSEKDGPSLPSALSEQLGLKFEATKLPKSYFVVESAKRPVEN